MKKKYSVAFEKHKKKLSQLETSIDEFEKQNKETADEPKLVNIKSRVNVNLNYLKQIHLGNQYKIN